MFVDGFDDCCLGYVERFGMHPIPLYDKDKMIDKMVDDGMTPEEAIEYFYFNIIGSWVGETTPCFMTEMDKEGVELILET